MTASTATVDETRTIRFAEPVPIEVVYWTAWIDHA